jgi:hypothetical protein
MKGQIFVGVGVALVAAGLASSIFGQLNMTGGNMTGGNMGMPTATDARDNGGGGDSDDDGSGDEEGGENN